MSVRSAAPPSAPLVYTTLVIAGAIAALIGAALIGIIVYNYATRPELRNPEPAPGETVIQGELPPWMLVA